MVDSQGSLSASQGQRRSAGNRRGDVCGSGSRRCGGISRSAPTGVGATDISAILQNGVCANRRFGPGIGVLDCGHRPFRRMPVALTAIGLIFYVGSPKQMTRTLAVMILVLCGTRYAQAGKKATPQSPAKAPAPLAAAKAEEKLKPSPVWIVHTSGTLHFSRPVSLLPYYGRDWLCMDFFIASAREVGSVTLSTSGLGDARLEMNPTAGACPAVPPKDACSDDFGDQRPDGKQSAASIVGPRHRARVTTHTSMHRSRRRRRHCA
jgi:hypothetical protein